MRGGERCYNTVASLGAPAPSARKTQERKKHHEAERLAGGHRGPCLHRRSGDRDPRRLLRFPEGTAGGALRGRHRLRNGRPRLHRKGQSRRGRRRPLRARSRGGHSLCPGEKLPAGAGHPGSELLPPSLPGDDHGGRHRHQRQDHHHLSSQGHSGGAGGQGGPHRHQPEYDRRGDRAHGADHAGIPGAPGPPPPDGGRRLHPRGDGDLLPRPL